MRTDFFLHCGAWVEYLVFGNSKRGYKAKANVSLLKSYPAEYVPIRLEKLYATLEEAEEAIIDFCKAFIEESLIEMVEEE